MTTKNYYLSVGCLFIIMIAFSCGDSIDKSSDQNKILNDNKKEIDATNTSEISDNDAIAKVREIWDQNSDRPSNLLIGGLNEYSKDEVFPKSYPTKINDVGSIKIIEKGHLRNYTQLMKIRVIGKVLNMNGETETFSVTHEYEFKIDSYNKWSATRADNKTLTR